MAYIFADLQSEVKRRATRDQSGTEFDAGTKSIINFSLFRVGREANWRQLRRTGKITTEGSYTTGSGAVTVTNNSKNVTITGATLLTNGIQVGRRISLGGSTKNFKIATITGETTLTLDLAYDGTSSSSQTYEIHGREEYTLPPQCGHRAFLWHEAFGYPYVMTYETDMEFLQSNRELTQGDKPTHYRMWGEDMVLRQPNEGSVVTVVSSSSSDTSKNITVFGTVSGYPDYEVIQTNSTNGTTSSAGSKSFTSIERVVKDSSTVGRITCTTNSGNVTVAVLPVGDSTGGILYKKVSLFPLPDSIYDINVLYYKDPWRLVNDGDMHELGQEFDEAIILLSVSKLKMETNQDEGAKFFSLYQDEVRNLKKHNVDKPDFLLKLKRPGETVGTPMLHKSLSYLQLGGSYGPTL